MISFALRRMILGVAGWWHLNAMSTLDFFNDRYMQRRVVLAQGSVLTLARASTFVTKDAAGLYQEFAANALARSNALGAYIGKEWVSKIQNPRGVGGVVGTVGVTNKCTNFNAKPTVGTSLTPSANVTLSFPDWSAQLATLALTDKDIASFLANGVLSGKVVAAHNSDVVEKRVIIGGTTGNTNPHSGSIYMAVVGGSARVSNSVSGTTLGAMVTSSATLTKFSVSGFTPSSSGTGLAVNMDPGATVYFILNDLTETATAAPVPTVVAGAAAMGALPSNMTRTSNGMSAAFLGATVENGLPKYRVRIFGTASGTTTSIYYEPLAGAGFAAVGQAWSFDQHLKYVSTPIAAPDSIQMDIQEYTAAGSFLNNVPAFIAPTTIRTRFEDKKVLNQATVARGIPVTGFRTTAAQAYDFTVDIYAPKLVQIAAIEGAEKNADASFDNAPSWVTNDASITVSAGSAHFAATPDGKSVYQSRSVGAGVLQKITVVVNALSAGALSANVNGNVNPMPTAGTYVFYGISSAASTVGIYAVGATTADVASFSVKDVSAGYMPAFPVLPAPGVIADSTKAADVLTYASMGWFSGSGFEVACSRLVVPKWGHNDTGVVRPLFELSVDANNYILGYINASGYPALKIVVGAATQTDTPLPYAIAVARAPLLFGWSAAGGYIVDAAGHAVTFGAVSLPTGLTTGRIGSSQAGLYLEDTLEYVETHPLLTQADALILAAAA